MFEREMRIALLKAKQSPTSHSASSPSNSNLKSKLNSDSTKRLNNSEKKPKEKKTIDSNKGKNTIKKKK
jgi:hypothetical protein